MTLSLDDQTRLVKMQPDFLDRITAACFAAGVTAFTATALTDVTKQAQRMSLVNAVIRDPTYAVHAFAWICVSRPAVNSLSDLTDAFIVTAVTNQFDTVAFQLFQQVV